MAITMPSPPSVDVRPTRGPALTRRLRRLGVSGRRMRRAWTRERTLEVVQTLAWTVPLTLLLWVWAQDQQVDEQTVAGVPLRISHTDPQRLVVRLDDDGPTSDQLTVSLIVRGPRASLSDALRPFREGAVTLPMDLELGPTQRTSIDLRQYLASLPRLADAGVSLVAVSPATIDVRVDRAETIEAPVVADYTDLRESELVGPPTFDPPAADIRGPAHVIAALRNVSGPQGPRLVALLRENIGTGEQSFVVNLQLAPEVRAALVDQVGVAEVGRLKFSPAEAEVRVRRRDRQLVDLRLTRIPIEVQKPQAMEGQFQGEPASRVVLPELNVPYINEITVRGPAETIDQLKEGGRLAGSLRAVLRVTREDLDATGTLERALEIPLPPDVTLVGNPPTVRFTVERGGS